MDYEKKYKEAVNKIRDLLDDGEKNGFTIVTYKTDLESIFPELKESEDEKVRKEIVEYLKKNLRLEWATWLEKQGESYTKRDVDDAYIEGMAYAKNELEKQSEQKSAWSEEDEEMLVDAYVMLDWYKGNNWWTARRIKDWLNSLKERIGG